MEPASRQTIDCRVSGKRDTLSSGIQNPSNSNRLVAHLHIRLRCCSAGLRSLLDRDYDQGFWKTNIHLLHRTNGSSSRVGGGCLCPPRSGHILPDDIELHGLAVFSTWVY